MKRKCENCELLELRVKALTEQLADAQKMQAVTDEMDQNPTNLEKQSE
jgi:hypothetical protein